MRAQQRIEQARLGLGELNELGLVVADGGDHPVFLQPLLRQHAERAVIEPHGLLTALERRQQRRERQRVPLKVHVSRQLKPVDAR